MFVNLDEVIRGHDHFLAENERMLDQASEVAAKHGVDHVNKFPEFRPRTGKLQKGMRGKVVRTRGGRIVRLTNNVKYAPAIDTGSKAHIIRPKQTFSRRDGVARRGSVLRFRVGGKLVFARKVNHPGTRPYKFGWRAAHSSHRVLGQELKRRMTALASRF